MTATYDWYFSALADPNRIGKSLKIHDGHPQPGFYRKRAYKDGPFVPVAIWQDDTGHMMCVVGSKTVDANDVWTYCCTQPITEELYRKVVDGAPWPDDAPAIGHNSAPVSDDPHDQLVAELAAETELAESLLKKPVATKDQADQIAVWSKRVAGIKSKADAQHKVEKQPFLDGGRAVDDRWRGIRDAADALTKRLKRALDDWLREQDRIERERQRVAAEEAAKARRVAEEAARQADQAPDGEVAEQAVAEAQALADRARDAEREAEPVKVGAGRTGAKVALRTFHVAEITDFDALLMALKDRQEVRELVQSLANRAAKAGVDLPGMKIVEERRAA